MVTKKGKTEIIEISGIAFKMKCLEHFSVHKSILYHYENMRDTINRTTERNVGKGHVNVQWVTIEPDDKEMFYVCFWGTV